MMPSQMYLMDEFLFSFSLTESYLQRRPIGSLSSYNHNHRTQSFLLLLLLFIKLFYDLQCESSLTIRSCSRFQLHWAHSAMFGNRFVQFFIRLLHSLQRQSREEMVSRTSRRSGEEFRNLKIQNGSRAVHTNLNSLTFNVYDNILCMNSVDNKIIIIKSLPMRDADEDGRCFLQDDLMCAKRGSINSLNSRPIKSRHPEWLADLEWLKKPAF